MPTTNAPAAFDAPTMATAAGTASAVSFRHVSKSYRRHNALSDIDFSIRAGEAVAIVGVNGAGKTTLLRCLLDFARPDHGTIEIFGVDSRTPAARRPLAFVPERFQPPAHLTGHEVLQWLAGLQGRDWTRQASEQAFERYSITRDALHRPVRLFSKGMTQKLALAAALMAGKRLLVLDEPMSGLDPQAREFVIRMLEQARDDGTGLLFSSHSLNDVSRLCDRLVMIHGGELRFVGTPAELVADQQATDLDQAFLRRIQ